MLAFASTLPFLNLALHGFDLATCRRSFVTFRGMGQGAVRLPRLTAAYASIRRQDLPIAARRLANIVQRLSNPTMTTLCVCDPLLS